MSVAARARSSAWSAVGGVAVAVVTVAITAGVVVAEAAEPDPAVPEPDTTLGTIAVQVLAAPADAGLQRSVILTPLDPASSDSRVAQVRDGGLVNLGELRPGRYLASLTPDPGWRLAAVDCTGASPLVPSTTSPAAGGAIVGLEAGGHVICRFDLIQDGRITVLVAADHLVPAATAVDLMVGQGKPGLAPRRTSLGIGGAWDLVSLPGRETYMVLLASDPRPSAVLRDVVCGRSTAPISGLPGGQFAGARVDLEPGQHTTCIFTLLGSGTVGVRVLTDPRDPDATFEYQVVGRDGPVSGSVAAGTESPPTELPAGGYDVRLDVSEDWSYERLTCQETGAGLTPSYPVTNASAAVGLDPGEHVSCTFDVVKNGRLGLGVETDSPDADVALDFDTEAITGDPWSSSTTVNAGGSQTEGPMPPATYELDLASEPDATWKLDAFWCAEPAQGIFLSGDGADLPAQLDIAPGAQIGCVFELITLGDLSVRVVTDPPDIADDFQFSASGASSPIVGTVVAGGVETVGALAGPYQVDVNRDDSWFVRGASCDEATPATPADAPPTAGSLSSSTSTPVAAIVPAAGHLFCTFDLVGVGSIDIGVETVVRSSNGQSLPLLIEGDDVARRESVTTGSTWSSGPLPARQDYAATLALGDSDWTIVSSDCEDSPDDFETVILGDPPSADIGLDMGDHVSCTFRVTDWIVPTAGRWRGVDQQLGDCRFGSQRATGKFRLVVQNGGARLKFVSGGMSYTLKPSGTKNVYTGTFRGWKHTWTVHDEGRITGTSKFKGCAGQRYTYTAIGG